MPIPPAMPERLEQPIPTWRRLYENGTVRKTVLLLVLALVWEAYARALDNPLLFPTLTATISALLVSMRSGELPRAIAYTLTLLLEGYVLGLVFAALLTALASVSKIGADLLEMLTSMFNPLPSIALLPLALIWFGLGNGSVIFVLVHAVLWSVALNTHAGFRALSPTLQDGGAELRFVVSRIHHEDPDTRCVSRNPDRSQGRMGVRVAHADRRGARLRRQLGIGRHRVVHLRAQEPAADPGGVCRAADRDPVRALRRARDLQDD